MNMCDTTVDTEARQTVRWLFFPIVGYSFQLQHC